MIRAAGGVIAGAGLVGALVVPVAGFPAAFSVLSAVALVLWFVGVATAAGCLVPARPRCGSAALVAAALAWPLAIAPVRSSVWGTMAAVCGLAVALDVDRLWRWRRDARRAGPTGGLER